MNNVHLPTNRRRNCEAGLLYQTNLKILQKREIEANKVISSELNQAFEELKRLVERGDTAAALKGLSQIGITLGLLIEASCESDASRHRLSLEVLRFQEASDKPVFQA